MFSLSKLLKPVLVLLLFMCSCATYYTKQKNFQYLVVKGDFKGAEQVYQKLDKPDGHNRLLFLMNMGLIGHLQGQFEKSNQYFEKAYQFSQDYHKNLGTDLVNVFVGPNANRYIANPLELMMINYYKTLNYVMVGDYQKAMVECRRTYSVLLYLDDKYSNDKKYQSDPYIYNFIGLVFEAGGEDNTGLVCLKRAVEGYRNHNLAQFGVGVPDQLKYDIIRLSKKAGDFTSADRYLKDFGDKFDTVKYQKGSKEILLFWHNGLAPIKTETNVVFTMTNNGGGNLMFVNNDFGFQIPVFLNTNQSNGQSINKLQFVRLAIPKYKERVPIYEKASVFLKDTLYAFEKGQDFNAVEFKILKDQLTVDLVQGITRVVIRQLASMAATKKDQDLVGLGMNILSFVAEKADTRSWLTIPHSVYYTRLIVPEDVPEINIQLTGESNITKVIPINTQLLKSGMIHILNISTPNVKAF